MQIESAMQQGVQYTGYLIATVFLCAGAIMINESIQAGKISLMINGFRDDVSKTVALLSPKDTDVCPNCGMPSKKELSVCEHCHGTKK